MVDRVSDSERGHAFVAARGDALQRACATALAAGRADPGLIALLEERFPPERDVAAAFTVLAVLDDVRARESGLVERACRALERAQGRDGGWELRPGAGEDERVFATGMLGGYLAKTRFARPEVLEGAGGLLAAHWSPARVKGGAWRALAGYAHYFANVPHDLADGVLQWCGRELERGFRTRRFDAVRSARVLVYCDAGAIPGARLRADELVAAVLAEQQPDGGWIDPADPDPAARVAHSVDALVALARLA